MALARNAGSLALLGGTVWVVATAALVAIASSFAWLGLIVAMVLVGGAAVGLQRHLGARTGNLGRWAAFATAAGSISTLALVLIALVTSGGDMTTTPPVGIVILSFVAFILWIAGSIVFALSLMRAEAIPSIAGWLIVLGAAVGTVALFASGSQTPSPLFYLPLGLYGVGWILVGLATRTPAVQPFVAGQPS
jgi:hypothetical protein